MSELTLCNHCTLESIKRRNPDKEIELTTDDNGWILCYVDDELVAGFQQLTRECVC